MEDDEFFEVSLTSQDSVILPSEPGRVFIRDFDGRKICALCIGIIKHTIFDIPSVRKKKCMHNIITQVWCFSACDLKNPMQSKLMESQGHGSLRVQYTGYFQKIQT